LLDLPDLAGWLLDPEELQSDAVALLQTRESRLMVSDQIKAEREAALVDAVVERELAPQRAMGAPSGEMALSSPYRPRAGDAGYRRGPRDEACGSGAILSCSLWPPAGAASRSRLAKARRREL
jgi:hypothetical protein